MKLLRFSRLVKTFPGLMTVVCKIHRVLMVNSHFFLTFSCQLWSAISRVSSSVTAWTQLTKCFGLTMCLCVSMFCDSPAFISVWLEVSCLHLYLHYRMARKLLYCSSVGAIPFFYSYFYDMFAYLIHCLIQALEFGIAALLHV